ncbi:nucleolar complex protein 2 [Prorops nasuta]|uniref:nucleolar complex protein 2 n=1 Tax=Prorops nasuta TaxID=863751 RepID=UPI0034CF052A
MVNKKRQYPGKIGHMATFHDEENNTPTNQLKRKAKAEQNTDESDSVDSDEGNLDPEQHKKSLMKLKETDPDFFKYLQQNDKNLLEFNLSDEDNENADSSADELEMKHIPDGNLVVASDESDYEPEDGKTEILHGPQKVTLKLLKQWQEDIQKDKSSASIKKTVEAFHAALQTISDSDKKNKSHLKVEGGAVFNGVIQLCILYLPAAFRRFLKVGTATHFDAHKSKRFKKVKVVLKSYLTDLIKVLQGVSSSNIQVVLLKHLHQMLPFTKSFSSLTKPLLRVVLKFWSCGEETVCIVAFLSILNIATNHKESVLEMLLKAMYVKYVENAKFVSPNTLPGINFMQHSLTEIYMLDHNLSYNHAFLYIRQLAIHLRNAVTLKKKENFQAVYNWQYINSLRFWTELIAVSRPQSMLRSLLYPLVQIITTTIKVIPTAQYYPLRFHCVQMLIKISRNTNTFIPILPFLLEVLNSYDFNKRHKAVSMKPLPLICVLRMSKSELQQNGFKDSVIETIYQLILENAAKDSHLICFPDLYIPCIVQLKSFLKTCKVPNYCKKMKQLLEKIQENRKYIESERSKVTLDLKNLAEISNWENAIKTQGTSIAKFYASWMKIHQSQKLKLLTKNDDVPEFSVPSIRKSKKKKQQNDENEDGFGNMESDNESEFELKLKNGSQSKKETTKSENKVQRPKKKKRRKIVDTPDDDLPREDTDIVRDINSADWD